jgi:predicted ATPase/DNA-binding winged helix-turn-helix (wHTH) protein
MSVRLRFGQFELRPAQRCLLLGGKPVRLGARAFDLLLTLVEHRDRLVTKRELLDLAWPGLVVEEANVQVQISAIRKALGPDSIATIPGRGYRFVLAEPHDDAEPVEPGNDAGCELPAGVELLIGRDEDVEALCRMVNDHRLVSVVGPGGVGKTRLALAVAHACLDGFPDGVQWLEMAGGSSPGDVKAAIARWRTGAAAPRKTSGRHLLLLDNCEHVADAVAEEIRTVLAERPHVHALITSQRTLHVTDEQVWRLEGLALPPVGSTAEDACRYGSVALFLARMRAADQRYAMPPQDLPSLVELCRRLEGNPLAIEMAASLASQVGVGTVRQCIADRIQRLHGYGHGVPERQRSLRAVLEWSWNLLCDDDRRVLRRLSVFNGGMSLELALNVAVDEGMDKWQVLDAMVSLVDRSLLHIECHEPPSYRMLETTRLYSLERLRDAGEEPAVRRRHQLAMGRKWRRQWQEPVNLQCWPFVDGAPVPLPSGF